MNVPKFQNEALTDFTDKKNKRVFEKALLEIKKRFNKNFVKF